jgi:hypothetical protein
MGVDMDGVTVLLGAGASKEAGMPLATELATTLLEYFTFRRGWQFDDDTALLFDLVHKGLSTSGSVDIERLFSSLMILADPKERVDFSPFIEVWNDDLFRLADKPGPSWAPAPTITRVIWGITDALSGILRPRSELLAYLAPLVRQEGVRIATLNYDLSIEEACRLGSIKCSTGADLWKGDLGRWSWPSATSVKLLKLHGSLDWFPKNPGWDDSRKLARGIEHWEELVHDPSHPSMGKTALIFGRREKMQPRGPFPSLLQGWRFWLGATRNLVIIGYSFSDDHINESIREWLSSPVARSLTIVDPGPVTPLHLHANGFVQELALVADRDIRILSQRTGEGLIEVFGSASAWPTPSTDRWGIPISSSASGI